ncbi:MAG: tetratricopeptide repeat protein [Thermoactinomyces sp.]
MKKTHVGINNKNEKIVRLRMDAGFFFERAVRSLDRHRYDKAVKYFRLAMELEPDNPVNYCNLAGILSELGRFEESNEVLGKVLDEVDPELYECLFYMANNAANMGDLELAEDYLLEYLTLDPNGEYAEEAEDMLHMLAEEMGRPPKETVPVGLPPYMLKHEEARTHLEEGRFLQAIGLLREIIEEHPEFMAARNNLALAYYYTGELEEAMKLIEQVLKIDPNNLHALCNLAVLSHHMGEAEKTESIIQMLKKLVPFHQEHTYKLATTLGILGEHRVAYELFVRLIKLEGVHEPSLYHYAAVAAWNSGRYERARAFWKKAAAVHPESEVPAFYLEHMDEWLQLEEVPKVYYHYQLPFEEQFLRIEPGNRSSELLQQIKSNPLIRSSFFWALGRGDRETKLHVLRLLGWIADDEVRSLLKAFIEQDEDHELREVALFLLRHIEATTAGRKNEKTESDRDKWKEVLDCCLENIPSGFSHLQKAIERLWTEWMTHSPEQFTSVRKVEGWAAALEYLAAKYHGFALTQKEVAEKYKVSLSTVSRHAKMLEPMAKKCFS